MGRRKGIGGDIPSLDVAQKYTLLARWYILAGRRRLWEVCAGPAAQSAVDREVAYLNYHGESMLTAQEHVIHVAE